MKWKIINKDMLVNCCFLLTLNYLRFLQFPLNSKIQQKSSCFGRFSLQQFNVLCLLFLLLWALQKTKNTKKNNIKKTNLAPKTKSKNRFFWDRNQIFIVSTRKPLFLVLGIRKTKKWSVFDLLFLLLYSTNKQEKDIET